MSFKRWMLARRTTQVTIILLILSPLAGLHVFQGNLASASLFDVRFTDPLAALQVMLASRDIVPAFAGSALLVAGLYFLLGGRTFCSWVCPVYLLTELADKVRVRLGSGENTFSLKMKQGTLLLTVIVTAVTGLPLFETISPIGIFNRALLFGGSIALFFIAAILLLEITVSRRLWCRSLCPVGGLYSLVGRFSPVKVKYVRSRCSGCGHCMQSCPVEEVLVPSLMIGAPTISSGECTRCGRCIDTCRDGALHMGIGYK